MKRLKKALSSVKTKTNQNFVVKPADRSNHSFLLSTVFTRKSAYAQKSAPLELAPPFENQKLNERLPRISAPLFPLKGRSFETDLLLKGHSIGIRSKTLIHGLAIFLC